VRIGLRFNGASGCRSEFLRRVAIAPALPARNRYRKPRKCRSSYASFGISAQSGEQKFYSADELSQQLYTKSGLLGLSEISDDLRVLLARDESTARDTVAYFVYWVGRHLGSLTAALGGLDALIFTGGVGEHLPEIRRQICQNAAWLGLAIDGSLNQAGGPRISPTGTNPSVWVIATDENLIVAKQTFTTLRQPYPA